MELENNEPKILSKPCVKLFLKRGQGSRRLASQCLVVRF